MVGTNSPYLRRIEVTSTRLLWLAVLWMLYFSLHSVLASTIVKQYVAGRFPRVVPAYRLLYNGVALVLLMPPLMLMYSTDSSALWQWRGGWGWAADGVALLAVAGFFWSLLYYNGQEFLGWRQAQDRDTSRDTHERLTISPLHRYVRHPWYFLALLLLWTRDMNAAFLVTCVAITGYFVVGSRLEENKLVAIYGDAYQQYMARVPGLIPWPSKRLMRDQAAALEQQANVTPPHAGG